MNIPAATFKAECLRLMDEVARTGQPIVITKHGRPVAQLTAVPVTSPSLFGYMRGTMKVTGDLIAPVDEAWSAVTGDEDSLYAHAATGPTASVRRRK
jgi:prevent-host-death family protein